MAGAEGTQQDGLHGDDASKVRSTTTWDETKVERERERERENDEKSCMNCNIGKDGKDEEYS